ncbi:DUF1585 domain-containing protein [Singulisphaera rosea]
MKNLARQWLVYATGREVAFRDLDEITAIVDAADNRGGGLRTLLEEVVLSREFQTR